MAETLQGITFQEIEESKARGEQSRWNLGPDGEMLPEGYTMNELSEVIWVGEGPEPIKEEKETTTTPDPLQKLFDHVSSKKYYTNSYEDFQEKYSSEEEQGKLYDFLKNKKAYTNSKGEFLDKYFPISNEEEIIETKEEKIKVETPDEVEVDTEQDDETLFPKIAKKIQGWFEPKKTKLELAAQNYQIETPVTKEEIENTTTELELSNSPRLKELEARLKDVPPMSQEAADILKEIETIKKATTEARVNPNNKQYQTNLNTIEEHNNKINEITDRVIATGGDQEEVNKQVNFYEKNNPEQTRLKKAKHEVKTINDGIKNIRTAKKGDDYSAFTMEEDEVTELNELVEQQIIENLSIKDMGRAAANNYTLKEKEAIIREAKHQVIESEYEKAMNVYTSATVLNFIDKKEDLESQITKITNDTKKDDEGNLLFETQQEVDAYNDLINQYNNLEKEEKEINGLIKSASDRLEAIGLELGYDAVSGVFENNFQTTDEYEEWKDKHIKERGAWGETYDAVATFVQEGVNLVADATLGTSAYIAGLMDSKINGERVYYDAHDILQDAYKNFAEYNYMGVSDKDADILDEDGNYTINARSASKTIAEMLPFTIGVIVSTAKGNLKPAKNMWTTIAPKFLTSRKGRSAIRMADASYRMTVNDNYHEAKDLGLSGNKAYSYANLKSIATGLSQMVMPDANFLGSLAGKQILSGLVTNLRTAVNKKAVGAATKQFFVNMGKELGEEELELALGDLAKYSVGIAHSPDILDIRTQKETIAATIMLSGSLGTVGTVSDIRNAKKQIYNQYKSNGQDIIDLLDDNLKVAEGKLKRARTQKSKDNHQSVVNQINDAKNYGQSIINAINSSPENVSDEQIDLLIEKQNLVNQKQGKDKAVSVGIDNQIKEIDEQISNSVIRQAERAQTAKIKTTVKEAIEKSGLEGNVSEMTSEEISNIEEQGFDSKAAAGEFGFIAQAADGSFNIILNKDKPMVGTAAHEFMHAVLFKTIGNDTKIQNSLGDALIDHVSNIAGDKSMLGKRLAAYGAFNEEGVFVRSDNFGEEVITIMSESIIDGSLKFEENFFTKVGDVIRRSLQSIGLKKIKFNTGRDVYNFVKDYSKNVKDGKINKAILNVAKEGAEGKLVEGKVTPEATVQMSKDASDNVQRIYEEQGEAGIFDILNEFKPIVSKIVQKRSEAPNFDRQLLTDEIETGKRGILDLVREYKPESGVPLAAYINKFLPARAIEASQRVLGEEFTQDVTEKVDIAAEEVTTETKAKPKPKKIVLADRLNVKSKVNEAIKKQIPKLNVSELTFKKLKNLVPEITGEMFGISPRKLKTLANITKKELQASQMFINKNADLLISMLPEGSTQSATATGVPNSLLKAFYTKTDRAKMAKTGSTAGLAVQVKNSNISKKDFLETFGIIDGKPTRDDRNTSARVLALANLTGKVMTNQAVRENLQLLGDSKQTIQNIKDGISSVMFSKSNKVFQKHNLPDLKINDPKDGFDNFDIFTDKMVLLATYGKPGLIRAVDLRGNITNSAVKEYVRSTTLYEELGLFTVDGKLNGVETERVYLRPDAEAALGKNIKNITKAKAKRYNEVSKANFDDMIDMIQKAIKDNPKDKVLHSAIFEYLSSAVNDTSHPMRAGAEYVGGDITATGEIIYEHALQNANVRDTIIDALLDNKQDFNKTLKAIQKNYKLIALSKKDAKAVDTATYIDENGNEIKYKNGMGVGWDIFVDNWFDRYFNTDVNAVDPNNIIVIENGKTFADEYGVTKSGKINFSKSISKTKTLDNAIKMSRTVRPSKGITVLDFDDTLATTESLVKYTAADGTTGTLNAEEYASTYEDLLDQGFTFDFSDFNKVVKGKLAPLFNKAIKLQGKFGSENMFVLTARPPQAQKAIFDFLKANGLNIPIKNITGLGNSTAEAKALWIADKVGEGYNDFYFADDALQNVQAVDNMLEQFDVKRKVQQAKVKFSKDMNTDFNNILEEVIGIESKKRFAATKARKRGASKGKFRFFIPPSHEDFTGLLYNFLGKGRQGDKHRDFFEQTLIRPLNRANREYDTARQSIANDYKALNKQFPDVKKKLTKKTPDGDFTFQDAVRVYLWNKHGHNIPGLSEIDQASLSELVMSEPSLRAYAETLNTISKQEAYITPVDGWESGDIRVDLDDATGRVGREQFFNEFNENADIIFSEKNLNKIEAGYGKGVREALEDMLYRIKTGRNRPSGQNRIVNAFMNYLNGSVGTVMFFNMRSALLQQMSLVNYINFADNNIFAAAKAFANQKQYWADWAFIFNSDMLKQRRGGIQTDVNGAELAETLRNSRFPTRKLISKLLELGFLPTQIGDNIAIATGGAPYYRNRINKYIKDGLSQKEAEAAAFTDFQNLTQSTQQSARPDMVSQQQASVIGKVILNFQNVTSQFNRLGKKAFQDIYNRRITKPNTTQMQSDISNAARITYYFAVQNAIFYTLQTALFMMLFDDDEEDENKLFLKKKERLINGSIDSVLRGSGVLGAIVSTLKNVAIAFARQRDVNYNPDESAVLMEALNLSPVLGIKGRKITNAEKTLNYNKSIIEEMSTFDIDNPQWSATTNYVEMATNVPLNRLYNKTQNVRQALNNDHSTWERTLMFLGWSQYNLNLENKKMDEVKETVKEKKKIKSKEKAKIKREEKKKQLEEENKAVIEENKKKSKEDGLCAAISTSGKRCKREAVNGGFCTVHEKTKKRSDNKEVQCRKRKSSGERCKMKTTNKSGFCYYHD